MALEHSEGRRETEAVANEVDPPAGLGEPLTKAPPFFNVRRCDCGTDIVVGPVEAASRRKVLCSACRADRITAAERIGRAHGSW
jgi:hypothetical protein